MTNAWIGQPRIGLVSFSDKDVPPHTHEIVDLQTATYTGANFVARQAEDGSSLPNVHYVRVVAQFETVEGARKARFAMQTAWARHTDPVSVAEKAVAEFEVLLETAVERRNKAVLEAIIA